MYALEVLSKERGIQLVSAALKALSPSAPLEARPVLLHVYAYYEAAGIKRDPGAPLRTSILDVLIPIAQQADCAVAERAALTYEFLPPTHEESVSGLRTTGLWLLSTLDPERAHYHAVRLLNDPHTSTMSGEPAISAARFLADHRQTLPLYAYVLHGLQHEAGVPEVMGEALKSLSSTPRSVIEHLLARYTAIVPRIQAPFYETRMDIELAGLFDLLLAHADHGPFVDFLETFLQKTQRLALYRYLASSIVAQRQPAAWAMLQQVVRTERNADKKELLWSALLPVQDDPVIAALLATLGS